MKRGQSLVIGFSAILLIAIIFIQLFLSQYEQLAEKNDDYKEVSSEAKRVGNMLSAGGAPTKWTISDVQRPGLVINEFIYNDTINEYSKIEYYKTKLLTGIKGDYIFFFSNGTHYVKYKENEFWGWSDSLPPGSNGGPSADSIISKIALKSNIGKNERFVRLKFSENSTPISATMTIYVWK